MTSSIFAVFSRFRVEGDLKSFLRDLKTRLKISQDNQYSNKSDCSSKRSEDFFPANEIQDGDLLN